MAKRWNYAAPYDIEYQLDIKGRSFSNEWFHIEPSGRAIVRKHYASDGCTPKFWVGDWFSVGVPDGPLDLDTGMVITARAFYIHDALIQFAAEIPVTYSEAHHEFCIEIHKTDFSMKEVYCTVVRHFGPQDKY